MYLSDKTTAQIGANAFYQTWAEITEVYVLRVPLSTGGSAVVLLMH